MRKIATTLASVGFLWVLMPIALAGNMAITSFDSIPEEFVSGETHTLTYTVLQHGSTPVDVGQSVVSFTNADTGEVVSFEGRPTGETGRYTVDVKVPAEGNWTWKVTQGQFEAYDFGTISVESPTATANPILSGLRVLLPLAAAATVLYAARQLFASRSVGLREPVKSS